MDKKMKLNFKQETNDKNDAKIHPLKGTVKDAAYKDKKASKHLLKGQDKDKLAQQISSAASSPKKRVADEIQNGKK